MGLIFLRNVPSCGIFAYRVEREERLGVDKGGVSSRLMALSSAKTIKSFCPFPSLVNGFVNVEEFQYSTAIHPLGSKPKA